MFKPPVVAPPKALRPIATLLEAVVFAVKASLPIATLLAPVVFNVKASKPIATLFDADPGGPSLYASHESQKERHELFKDITDDTVSRQEVARAPTPPA